MASIFEIRLTLSWWASYTETMGFNVLNLMAWSDLKHLMIEEYYPYEEMKKLEQDLLNLMMKEAHIAYYTNCFNDLTTLCPRMVTPEYNKIERYIWGLRQPIQGLLTASKPTTYDNAKRLTFNLTNQEICHSTMVQKVNLPNV